MKLGARLAAIAAFILPGARVADIGTDHGYLPAFLIGRGDVSYVVAGDINRAPLDSARELVQKLNLTDKVTVRLGDGLQVIQPEEVDTVVIAGMGGTTMIDILTVGWRVTCGLRRLILQPMVGAGSLRHWLINNGFHLVDEQLVKEDGRIYEIIVAEQGADDMEQGLMLELGPLLWLKRDPLLKEYWQELIIHLRMVQDSLRNSSLGDRHPKIQEYEEKINYLEEHLACL